VIRLLPYGAEYVPDEPETETERLRRRVAELEKAAAEVVAELRQMETETTPGWGCERSALTDAAALVEKLGAKS
jgi:glycine/D-amino acid oxidase-like deaminating enzyme